MNQIEYMKKTFDFIDKALGLDMPFNTLKMQAEERVKRQLRCNQCGKDVEVDRLEAQAVLEDMKQEREEDK